MSLSYFRITKQSAPKKLKYIFLYKVCLSKYSIKKYKCTGFISLFWKRFAYGKVLFSFNLWHFFLEFNFFFTGFLYSRTNIQMDMNLMLLCGKYSVFFYLLGDCTGNNKLMLTQNLWMWPSLEIILANINI